MNTGPSDEHDHDPPLLSLQEAADALGVHYMTAYRYVKLGMLHAEKHGRSWVITADDLESFRTAGSDQPAPMADVDVAPEFLEQALVAGNEEAAWQLVERATAAAEHPVDVHTDLLAPALASIGRRWASGELTIADEHKASAVATRILARVGSQVSSPGRRRGTAVIGSAPGDIHSIPTSMFADMIRSCGVDVIDLGGSPDVASFLEAVRRHPAAIVVITVTGPGHEHAVRSTVDTVRAEHPGVTIAIGGGAVGDLDRARSLGADLWADDPRQAARLIADAAAERQVSVRASGH